jgi:putative NADPH-quinone reductase
MKPPAVAKNITIIQGHPDASRVHFGHALADSYAAAAIAAGHAVRRVEVGRLDFPLLRTQEEWNTGPLPAGLREAQAAIGRADHLVVLFPLWQGTMPALLKGFFEQVLRPGFALRYEDRRFPYKALAGKSARVIVTMGMPAFWYRWFFRAHGVRGLERSILAFCGIKPVRESLVGLVESKGDTGRRKWLDEMVALGRRAV